MGVPTGWKDDGTLLTAPNGKSVVLEFRRHILTHSWASDDWPIESEHYEPLLDITNPHQGDGIVQHFRKSILAWQEHRGQVLDLWSSAIALAWQRQAQSQAQSQPQFTGPPKPTPVTVPALPGSSYTTNSVPTGAPTTARYATSAMSRVIPHPANQEHMAANLGPAGPNALTSADRLASLEKQVQMLIDGLGAGTKPKVVAMTIRDKLAMIATATMLSTGQNHPLSSPKVLIRWISILLALLSCDIIAWGISALIHQPATLPLPLLALGTIALSALFFFLMALWPQSKP